jgi:hypothetical protein
VCLILAQGSGFAVRAETIAVAENDIRSLANAPEVLEISRVAGADGRLALLARLRFANSCLAGAGAVALSGTPFGGLSHLAILQRRTPDGCPDIFQPTERQALIALGADTAEIRLIARPAGSYGAHSLGLVRPEATAPAETPIAPTEAFAADATLPSYEVASVAAADGGYLIAGVATVGEGCDPASIRPLIYEVPDAEGTPIFDAVVLTAPQSCAVGGRRLELEIRVSRPTAGGWRVYVANEARPALRPMG